jgi:hypothetical protein
MEYTYQNWLKGKFNYKDIYDENDNCRVSESDIEKINQKQEKLFDKGIEEETKRQKQIISDRFENSPNREQFIETYLNCFEMVFNKPLNEQVIDKKERKFIFYNQPLRMKQEYINYEGVIKILKEDFDQFQQIHRKYVIQNIKNYKVIDSPKKIKSYKIVNDYVKVYVANNIYEYLNELKKTINKSDNQVNRIPIEISELYKRNETIQKMYDGLYPNYIDITLVEFMTHFGPNFTQITWKKSEPELKALIDMLVGESSDKVILKDRIVTNNHVNKLIIQHFKTKLGKSFKPKQLSSMKKESSYYRILNPNFKESSNLYLLVKHLETLKK